MSYTLSCDVNCKVGKEGLTKLLHHTARDVDRANGCEVNHRNKQIDSSRTAHNETYVRDGDGWRRCFDTREIKAGLRERLRAVKKTIRHDAVVLREVILQIDPKWMRDHPEEEEQQRSLDDMMDWAKTRFGNENVLYYSVHRDETNWHIHVGVCPVTDDGRLAQKDWFGTPAMLRGMAKSFLEHMQGRGYDVAAKEKKPGDPSRHLSVEEYKAFQDALAEERNAAVKQAEAEADAIIAAARLRGIDAAQSEIESAWRVARLEMADERDSRLIALQRYVEDVEERSKVALDNAQAKAKEIREGAETAAQAIRAAAETEARQIIASAAADIQESAVSIRVDMDVAAGILANCKSLAEELTEQQRQRMDALDAQRQRMAARAEALLPADKSQKTDEPTLA